MRIWVIIFTLFCVRSFGQNNLVPNPGFEIFDTCPNSTSDLHNAVPWFQPNAAIGFSTGSTDFFHSCSSSFSTSVPQNVLGHQYPRTGQGYGGFGIYGSPNDYWGHEYMETVLTSPMDSGALYCVSFYVSLSNLQGICGTSAIGAYFSVDSCLYNSSSGYPINVLPQAINDSDNIITDTVNWIRISTVIRSQGGESFITLGNFWGPEYNSTNYDTMCGAGVPYFFIDDISVIKLPELYAGANDTLVQGDTVVLTGGISENWGGMQFEWFPHDGLVDPYSLSTTAHPDSTTTYTLTVTCSTCDVPCLDDVRDSVTLHVSARPPLPPFRVPTLFMNDQFFQIENLQPESRLKLYDAQGRLVYWSDNYRNDFALTNLSAALYNYEIELADSQKFTGKFVVVER